MTPIHPWKPVTNRLFTILGIVGITALAASLMMPGRSEGRHITIPDYTNRPLIRPDIPRRPEQEVAGADADADAADLLGVLVGRSYRIQIHAADPDPLYTVLTLEGSPLARRLTREELEAQFPDLPALANHHGASPEPGDDAEPLLGDVPPDGRW